MKVSPLADLEPGGAAEPLTWTGKYVYIRSIESVGLVSGSQQNGKPLEGTITVTLIGDDGYPSKDNISVVYTMAKAREDLVPDIKYLMLEEPELETS